MAVGLKMAVYLSCIDAFIHCCLSFLRLSWSIQFHSIPESLSFQSQYHCFRKESIHAASVVLSPPPDNAGFNMYPHFQPHRSSLVCLFVYHDGYGELHRQHLNLYCGLCCRSLFPLLHAANLECQICTLDWFCLQQLLMNSKKTDLSIGTSYHVLRSSSDSFSLHRPLIHSLCIHDIPVNKTTSKKKHRLFQG